MGESKDEKTARLAQALRDNLRRRKAQARAGGAPLSPAPSLPPAPSSPPAIDTPEDDG